MNPSDAQLPDQTCPRCGARNPAAAVECMQCSLKLPTLPATVDQPLAANSARYNVARGSATTLFVVIVTYALVAIFFVLVVIQWTGMAILVVLIATPLLVWQWRRALVQIWQQRALDASLAKEPAPSWLAEFRAYVGAVFVILLGVLAGAIAFAVVCFPIGIATYRGNDGNSIVVAVILGTLAAGATMCAYYGIVRRLRE